MKKIMPITVGKKKIGPGQPVFIVAEMSGNHGQDIKRAYEIIDKAAEVGADAIKLQTYTPDTITIDSDKEYFIVKDNAVWRGKKLYELYGEAYTPWDWQSKLKLYANKKGLIFFSTPFDSTAVDFLEKIGVDLYKVASFEVPDIPLLEKIGKTGKPVIISRGMASLSEINLAIKTLRKNGSSQVAVLHCVSAYPAPMEDMNVSTVADISKRLGVISGLSDHSLEDYPALGAVALGASIIEKHFTLNRALGGPDASFSLEPVEFKKLVIGIREMEKVMGRPNYRLTKKEKGSLIFRKSIFVVRDVKKGERFSEENLRIIRPGFGLAPKFFKKAIGRRASRNIERGTPFSRRLLV